MTWSMFAINWLDLGDLDKAADNFHRAYSLYRRTPFNVSMAADNFHRSYSLSLYRRTPFNVSMAADNFHRAYSLYRRTPFNVSILPLTTSTELTLSTGKHHSMSVWLLTLIPF